MSASQPKPPENPRPENPRHLATPDEPSASLLGRIGEALLYRAEKIIAHTSKVGDKPVFDANDFPWVKDVEARWTEIETELHSVLERRDELPNFQDVASEVGNINTDNNWKTFFFYGYGSRMEGNCQRCPVTTEILENMPGMKTAFFSILAPRKHIPAHVGPYKGVLRFHLGLQVPEPKEQCRIRVADEICTWDEGKAIMFDDTYSHEVWNDTDGQRVVLFVDVVRPCRFPGNLINGFILGIASSLSTLKKARQNHAEWEKSFYHK